MQGHGSGEVERGGAICVHLQLPGCVDIMQQWRSLHWPLTGQRGGRESLIRCEWSEGSIVWRFAFRDDLSKETSSSEKQRKEEEEGDATENKSNPAS